MDRESQSRLIDLALAGAVTVVLPLVAFVTWPFIRDWMTPLPQGAVLIYEVDPDFLPSGMTVDLEQLSSAIDRRVNSPEKLAQVRQLDDRRIEVALLRQNEADTQQVERLLAHSATLEFRILANDPPDKVLIKRAMAAPSTVRIVDGNDNLRAWWVPVKAGEEAELADYSDIARRTKKLGNRDFTEVLVVKDDHDLNGTYVKRAEAGVDRRGRPKLSLTFNTKGGQLFRDLTRSHLPAKTATFNYKLGIILNGELCSAPLIVSTIYDHAQITGSFTKQEVDDLVSMLNTGGLPRRIRLVTKRDAL